MKCTFQQEALEIEIPARGESKGEFDCCVTVTDTVDHSHALSLSLSSCFLFLSSANMGEVHPLKADVLKFAETPAGWEEKAWFERSRT